MTREDGVNNNKEEDKKEGISAKLSWRRVN